MFNDIDDYFCKRGITPGRRGFSNSPETFQSDLVDAEVGRIMGDRDELADLLGKLLEVQPEIASLLALLVVKYPGPFESLDNDFICAEDAMACVVERVVRTYCEMESEL